MPTLTIEGRSVAVDDSFLKLSPDDQSKTVDEIAQSLGAKGAAVGGSAPTSVAPIQPPTESSKGIGPYIGELAGQVLSGIPVAGAYMDKVPAAIGAAGTGVARALGMDKIGGPNQLSQAENFGDRVNENEALFKAKGEAFAKENPIASGAAHVAGGVLGTAPLIAAAPAAFGVAGASLPVSVAAGATSGAALGGADALARGDDPLKGVMWGAGGGAGGNLIGKGVGAVIGKAVDRSLGKVAPHNELAAAAQRQGVDFPKVAASDSLVTQRTGAALKEIPVLGDPIVKASRAADSQMGDALTRVEQGFGSGSAFNAGDVAKTGLVDWITGKSADTMKRVYKGVDSLVDPNITRDLDATRGMIANISAGRQQGALPGAGKASELVLDAVQRPGGLNYEGLKTLRTSIGDMMDHGMLPADINKTELRRIYGALTSDLRATVEQAGGLPALKAFNKANALNILVSNRRNELAKIIGVEADAAPERVVDRLIGMASGNARADQGKLLLARKTIGPDKWDEVASAAVSKMGRDVEGNFSAPRFLTSYGKLSPTGKATLFGTTGKSDLAAALDDIALLSSKAKELGGYGNPSGTGRVLGGMSVLAGGLHSPHLAAPAAAGAWLTAKNLARPIRVKPATLRLAAQNAEIGKLLDHAITGGTIGATSNRGAPAPMPPQILQPAPAQIQ